MGRLFGSVTTVVPSCPVPGGQCPPLSRGEPVCPLEVASQMALIREAGFGSHGRERQPLPDRRPRPVQLAPHAKAIRCGAVGSLELTDEGIAVEAGEDLEAGGGGRLSAARVVIGGDA